MAPFLDLAALLSADNATRNAAEAALNELEAQQPAMLANQLVGTLADGAADPVGRTLCAVLMRRRLPGIVPSLSEEWRAAVKSKLLEAISSPCDASLRRKVCDAVGRMGVEFHGEGGWPELMEFVRRACTAGEPTTHEAALTVISHMAPALIDPLGWAAIGAQLQGMLVGAMGDSSAPTVSMAALDALASMLSACAAQEQDEKSSAERKKLRAVADSLQSALPSVLRVLELAVGANDSTRIGEVLSHLSTVAMAQPRLFKPVLAVVVEGMAQLAAGGALESDERLACAELLVTLAEGSPKMCSKLPSFVPRVLGVLLPMMLRLEMDLSEWEAATPEDGLGVIDDDNDDEKEAGYAGEALERLCEALGGEAVLALVLPELTSLLDPSAAWTARHAGLVAVASLSEYGTAVLEPHLPSIVGVLKTTAHAPEPRLRWATHYALGLLCDEFNTLAENSHAELMPLIIGALSDASPRVRAAAALAAVNLCESMDETALLVHAQPLLGALHSILTAPTTPDFVAFAACSALALVAMSLNDAPSRPMGSVYAAFMPNLAQRLGAAVDRRQGRLATEILAALGSLAAASGPELVAADAPALLSNIGGLLSRKEVTEDRALLRATHTALTKLGGAAPSACAPVFSSLMPALLASATIEVDFNLEKVEVQEDDERDDGWETQYFQNKGRGMLKLRVNASQMDEKLLAIEALYTYAAALGSAFHPAVRPLVEACLPTLTYRFSDKARGWAACALAESYKCIVLAAAENTAGMTMAHAAELLPVILKPLSEQLNKEESLEAADSLLEAMYEILVLERTHHVGAFTGQAALSGILQLLKRQMHLDEKRLKARAEAAADRDEDEAADEEDEEAEEQEGELLSTCTKLLRELLSQMGAPAVAPIEAQLLPHVQTWLLGEAGPTRLALGLEILAAVVEHAGKEHGKKYVLAAMPLLEQHVDSEEAGLRRAALFGLGCIAEHGGKLLTRNAAKDLAKKLLTVLEAPSARYSGNVEASEAAAAALGKVLVHRPQAVAEAGMAVFLPTWLGWLPLRYSEDDHRAAIGCLCKLLEAEAGAVLGTDGGRFPAVLGAMTAAYESELTGGETSSRMRTIVQGWNASNPEALRASAASLSAAQQEKLGRMASVA